MIIFKDNKFIQNNSEYFYQDNHIQVNQGEIIDNSDEQINDEDEQVEFFNPVALSFNYYEGMEDYAEPPAALKDITDEINGSTATFLNKFMNDLQNNQFHGESYRKTLSHLKTKMSDAMVDEAANEVILESKKCSHHDKGAIRTHAYHKKKNLATKNRLASKLEVEKAKKELQQRLQDIDFGIQIINKGISQATQGFGLQESEKANAMMRELIEEQEKESAKKQKKQREAKVIGSESKESEIPKTTVPKKSQNSPKEKSIIRQQKSMLLQGKNRDKLSKFASELCSNSLKCSEHPRIHRWKTMDVQEIRNFKDNNANGEKIQHYKDLADQEIFEQRVRHYLPGTEHVLKDPFYRNIYAFPTDRGYGMVAQLTHHKKTVNGVLYFGIDKTDFVFHKYFEDTNFMQKVRNIFQDKKSTFQEQIDSNGQWESTGDFNLDVSDDGVLQFHYSDDHALEVYPLSKDLFKQKLSKIK